MQRQRGCERKNHPHHVSGGCGRQLPENHISPILRSVVNQTLQNLLQRSLATDFNQILLLLPGCWGCCCCCCNNRRIVILLLEWVAAVYTRPHERLQHHHIVVSQQAPHQLPLHPYTLCFHHSPQKHYTSTGTSSPQKPTKPTMSGNCNSSNSSFMLSAESLIHLESSTPDSQCLDSGSTHNLDSVSVRDSKSCPSHDPLPLLQPSSYRSSSSSQSIPQFLYFYQLHQKKKVTTRAQQQQRRLSKSCNKTRQTSPHRNSTQRKNVKHMRKNVFPSKLFLHLRLRNSFFFPFFFFSRISRLLLRCCCCCIEPGKRFQNRHHLSSLTAQGSSQTKTERQKTCASPAVNDKPNTSPKPKTKKPKKKLCNFFLPNFSPPNANQISFHKFNFSSEMGNKISEVLHRTDERTEGTLFRSFHGGGGAGRVHVQRSVVRGNGLSLHSQPAVRV